VYIPNRRPKLHLSDEKLEQHRANWQPLERPNLPRYLRRYAKMVTSGSQGAVLEW
jgi:dihydroxy-acid dehydratase